MGNVGARFPETTLDLGSLLSTQAHTSRIILNQIHQQPGCFVLTPVRERPYRGDRLFQQLGHQGQSITKAEELARHSRAVRPRPAQGSPSSPYRVLALW